MSATQLSPAESSARANRRTLVKAMILSVIFVASFIGFWIDRASIGDTRHSSSKQWWCLNVIRTPEGTHRFEFLTDTHERDVTGEGERLAIHIYGRSSEEFTHKGHWLLDGLVVEHRIITEPFQLSDAPQDALAVVLDPQTRVRLARMLGPLLVDMQHRPTTLKNGSVATSLNLPRLALRVSLPAMMLVSAALLVVIGYRVHRRIVRAGTGLCEACGYDLRGLDPHSPCPECGARR